MCTVVRNLQEELSLLRLPSAYVEVNKSQCLDNCNLLVWRRVYFSCMFSATHYQPRCVIATIMVCWTHFTHKTISRLLVKCLFFLGTACLLFFESPLRPKKRIMVVNMKRITYKLKVSYLMWENIQYSMSRNIIGRNYSWCNRK